MGAEAEPPEHAARGQALGPSVAAGLATPGSRPLTRRGGGCTRGCPFSGRDPLCPGLISMLLVGRARNVITGERACPGMHLGGYHRNRSLFIPSELIRVTRKGLGTGCGLHGETPRTKPRTHSLTLWGPGRWRCEGQCPACPERPAEPISGRGPGLPGCRPRAPAFERSVGTRAAQAGGEQPGPAPGGGRTPRRPECGRTSGRGLTRRAGRQAAAPG